MYRSITSATSQTMLTTTLLLLLFGTALGNGMLPGGDAGGFIFLLDEEEPTPEPTEPPTKIPTALPTTPPTAFPTTTPTALPTTPPATSPTAARDGCTDGKVFNPCGSACPTTCDTVGEFIVCTEQCSSGCFCPDGQVLNEDDGKCIDPAGCPSATTPFATPTAAPTATPTTTPTATPTAAHTEAPSMAPTGAPTYQPTVSPTTLFPTTGAPTTSPTLAPTSDVVEYVLVDKNTDNTCVGGLGSACDRETGQNRDNNCTQVVLMNGMSPFLPDHTLVWVWGLRCDVSSTLIIQPAAEDAFVSLYCPDDYEDVMMTAAGSGCPLEQDDVCDHLYPIFEEASKGCAYEKLDDGSIHECFWIPSADDVAAPKWTCQPWTTSTN